MSVHARSLAVVVALAAVFAAGAPAAIAGEDPDPVAPAAAEAPVTPAEPPLAADPAPAEPAPVEPPAAGAPLAQPAPVDPTPVQPTPVEPSTEAPPAEPAPEAETPAAGPAPADPAPAQPAPSPGGQPGGSGSHAGAHNVNTTIQAIWQVQQGCQSHCHGTSQVQRSVQVSETSQSATAISDDVGGGGSSAGARNESRTIQFVWQMQLGCVAFCFDTSQSQEASQRAHTSQEAVAESALAAWAENLAETAQHVFQTQRGCEHECHGATQHQSIDQGQTTSQSVTATALGDGGSFLLPDWLIAYARNIGATIQTVFQYQEALCLEQCTGDSQLQEAAQHAATDQHASATAGPPPAPAPAEPSPGEEPPGEQPAEPAVPGREPEAGAPSVAEAGPLVAAAHALDRKRRRSGRQDLVFQAAPTSGGPQRPQRPLSGEPAHGGPGSGGAGPPTATASGASAPATAPAAGDGSRARGRTASDSGERLPASAFTVPETSSPSGSLGWLAILFLTAAVATLVGSLRRALATHMTRI